MRKALNRIGAAVGNIGNQRTYRALLKNLSSANMRHDEMQEQLRRLSRKQRERLARKTATLVWYYGEEVTELGASEEEAALRAAPRGVSLDKLNGINVGCGNRMVNEWALGIDAHRGPWTNGSDHVSTPHWLGDIRRLPFQDESVDYVIALHALEHVSDPVGALKEYLRVCKPGGGVGVVVPDWRYTWDSRHDTNPWGHRWNPTPSLVLKVFESELAHLCTLEHLDTYEWRLSFDFVLRKNGRFSAESKLHAPDPTGRQLWETAPHLFLHSDS